jgi:tripartite-type tricarboxylate transporter receptor subunit TctC
MAPNTPKEALAEVQHALRDLANDEEFHADAMKTMKFVPEYDTSAQAETIYRGKVAPNPSFVSFFEKYIEEGKAQSARK